MTSYTHSTQCTTQHTPHASLPSTSPPSNHTDQNYHTPPFLYIPPNHFFLGNTSVVK
ncbi:hypothetical protein BU24DRAFT_427157 [Aaosphaeria arxii CBS 175.79]|uniref:Uncharacterized protein n=1 Tax=Aaosphaeria arxii CBS 175.79 TaxID=1450172 RepID=A0A6A5XDS2_9PLEO|nr:uncharacterized protein BU24DRAFT_427157 [Aaosphaeria arxii CBS 175.79]KAF2010957.1 hypothetical protein BU24DRAFT_427157 [Aaosphaeria arxii CBS 175.79]